jgi:hypothetical protein
MGQIKVGDNVDLSANGTISGGYTGSYGNQVLSSHGLTLGGTGTFTGDYYDPRFVSFAVSPYFNQSRANSDIQSITNATGVSAFASIFSGSHFPGSVFYTRSYNKTGNYSIPGLPDYVTSGDGQAISVGWSANVPDLPTLTTGFTKGNSSYSVYGTDNGGNSDFENLYVNSQYRWQGFNLNGGLGQGSGHSEIPQVFTGQQMQQTNSDNRYYNFAVTHATPLHGSTSFAFNRNDLNSDYLGYKFKGSIDTLRASVGFYPMERLNVALDAGYSDNLYGQIYQTIVPTTSGTNGGGTVPIVSGTGSPTVTNSQSSHAWDFNFSSSYSFPTNLILTGSASRREQLYQGISYSSDSFGGGGLYTHPLAGGFLNANAFVTDTIIDTTGSKTLGFITAANYTRNVSKWNVSFGGNYNQNAQTLLISYTTSSYAFGGNVGRKFGGFAWTGGANYGHSALTAQPNTSYLSQGYSTGLGWRGYSVQGSYSKFDGNSLATSNGITPVPPVVISPDLLIFYAGNGYSVTASGAPKAGLTFSATYLKSNADTTTQGIFSNNFLEEELAQVQYRFRKMGFTGGYSHIVQSFSGSNAAPANFSTFSISVYRWFNFF